MPGEGAGSLLFGRPDESNNLICAGLGFAIEPVSIDSTEPLVGSGLVRAIKAALTDALCAFSEMDFRITAISGEQYYFNEPTLALAPMLHAHNAAFAICHPAKSLAHSL